MTSPGLRLLLDEMHAPVVAATLGGEGWDVEAVAGDPALRGLADEDLLIHARVAGRAIVTENVADFARLAAQWAGEGRDHAGIVFTNPRTFNRATRAYPANLTVALRELLRDSPIGGGSRVWWL